jgi:peptide/nickel transport system permease protein
VRQAMLIYILRRFVAGVVVFVTVTSLCYLLYNVRGGYAIAFNLIGPFSTPEQVNARAESLGLNRPLLVQYAEWLAGVFRGDLGQSYFSNQDVTAIMMTRVPVTLSLILGSMLLTAIFATLLGVLAASRGGAIDRGVQSLSVILGALPSYWLALVIVIVFALNLRLFPATGFIPIQRSVTGWLSTIALPSIAIALGAIFGLAVWIRSSIIDMRRKDWVRTLRSRGLSERAIMYRHVLRNAAAPTVQMLGLMVIGLVGGTIIVERIFALPGVGMMALGSGQDGDIPVVLGAVTFMVVVIVITNLLVDILNGFLNPKARAS